MHAVPPLLAQLQATLPGTRAPEKICAPFGGEQSIQLQDHSIIELNSGTCIIPKLSATKRLIELDSGEAIFQVAHDPLRPFIVETGPLAIQALGTQFDVYRKELATRVSVIEGSVQVSSLNETSPLNTAPLTILQQLDIPDDTGRPKVRKNITGADFDRITAWVHGYIELDAQTLGDTFEDIERYQHVHVEFKDPRLSEIHLSGRIHTNELWSLLKLLQILGIHSDYDETRHRITLTLEPGDHVGTQSK